MKLVENYKEISPLLMKYFKKGLMTNNFLSEAQYKNAIKSKALQFYEWDDGIIFLNAKESFSKLTYELLSLNSKLNVKLPEKTIIEIVSKQKPHIIIDKLLLDILLSYLSTISLNKYAINIPKINGDNTLLT